MHVEIADGMTAAQQVSVTHADAWITDDVSWPQLPGPATLAPGAGRVIATSPLYFVLERRANPLPATARSWLGLARLLAHGSPWQLRVGDPAASGDGMVAAGGLADAVLAANGPLVSALNLMQAGQHAAMTTIDSANPGMALPSTTTQVGVLPEYLVLRSGKAAQYTLVAPSDGTGLMRYYWSPTASGVAVPSHAAALAELYRALSGPNGAAALSDAGLRGPTWPAPAPRTDTALPALTAPAMSSVSEHFMYHVLSTFHEDLRKANVLIVVDVSGSMAEHAPGSASTKIALMQAGITQVSTLLPDDASVGLWRFGSQLSPPNDWQTVLAPATLSAGQRAALRTTAAALKAQQTGTALYSTIRSAYAYQQAHFSTSAPNEVLVFTDGIAQDAPSSISLAQLHSALNAADPTRRVQLSVFGIGTSVPTGALTAALAPVGGQVDQLTTPDQVAGAFIHAVSGAMSGVPG